MKLRHVKQTLSQLVPRQPDEVFDERIHNLLCEPPLQAQLKHQARTRRMKVLAWACGLLTAGIALGIVFGTPWLQPHESIVWAQVEHALAADFASARTMHLTKTLYRQRTDSGDPEVVTIFEIWVERPGRLREDRRTDIAQYLLDNGGWALPRQMTVIYNEQGEWAIDHTARRWAMRPAETLLVGPSVMGSSPVRSADYMRRRIDFLLEERFQFPGMSGGHGQGTYVRTETTPSGEAKVYRFEGVNGSWTLCWLSTSDGRLLKVQYGREGMEAPLLVYDPIEYDLEPPAGCFEFDPGSEYTNGQVIGLEDQPNVIHPDLVAVELEEHSVTFRRLKGNPGESRPRASQRPKDAMLPDLRVYFETESGILKLEGRDYGVMEDGAPAYVWGATVTISPLGHHRFAVDRQLDEPSSGRKRMDILSDLEYDGKRPVAVELLSYGADRLHCKVAYDADRDGAYDAWAQIAEPIPNSNGDVSQPPRRGNSG
jgi:hypothetical protein